MSKKKLYKKHLQKGRFYVHGDNNGGHPAFLYKKRDRKNLYLGRRGASGRNKDGERNKGYSEVTEEYGKRFNIWNG